MVHQYKLNGYNIVLDTCSGSVHTVDEVAYDVVALYPDHTPDEIVAELLVRHADKPDVTREELLDCIEDVRALVEAGKLYSADTFENLAIDYKNNSKVVKALCLHVAHTCNLNCSYCFASQGKYHGDRALMSFEVGKQALDFLIANSGTRRNLEVDFFGGEPMMNIDVVKELVAYARSVEKAHGKNFRFTLTTNGMLLDEDVMDYLNRETNRTRTFDAGVAEKIAAASGGDVRRALTLFENAYLSSEGDALLLSDVTPFESNIANYSDDIHFDLLSALQKSIRGSDPDAAVFYLNRLLASGELLAACRRLQVIASEDIGLAYPMAPVIVRACCESARELGMPEARIPLSNAAVMLATAPKSNSAYLAAAAANEDIEAGRGKIPPKHIQSPLFEGYVYPHDFPNHYTRQQYLPDDLRDRVYYKYAPNKTESAAAAYADAIGSRKKGS